MGSTRYSDLPTDWRTRLAGLSGTASVMLGALGLLLFTWQTMAPPVSAPAPAVVTFKARAATPDTPEEVPDGPRQVEQQARKAVEAVPPPPDLVVPRPAPGPPPPPPQPAPAAAADPVPVTTAPKALPAPAGPRAASEAATTWEARLLAHLEKYRRYPPGARDRREQGVAHVRFRMNRAGGVLAVALIRSSGSAQLDRAALDTIRRAAPLPTIPEDKPDPLELSIPVEFFLD
ncbi:MAG: TonB family protein [Novosphingobium sp.]